MGIDAAQRRAPLDMLAQDLGVVFERELDLADPLPHLARHVAQRTPLDIGIDIDAPRDPVSPDHAVGLADPDIRHVAQANLLVVLGIDHQSAYVAQVVADFRRAPDDDVEHLLVLKQGSHRDAADQRRGCAADVPGLQPVLAGALEVDLDLERGLRRRLFDAYVLDTLDALEDLANLLGFAANDLQVMAVDA